MKQEQTYKRACCHLIRNLLINYLRQEFDIRSNSDHCWRMGYFRNIPNGALVVPVTIIDAGEWFLGWHRGKSKDGYDLIESVLTHRIVKVANCSYMYLENLDFANRPEFYYSDNEYEIIDRIKKRVAKHNYWFVVGFPKFYNDGSFDLPIRKKFTDTFFTKKYRNLKSCTIKALDEHCMELNKQK